MKQKLENVMRNKKVMIALMEILIAIGCIVIFYLMMSSNNRAKETTYSYSKVEEVTEYRVVDNYITRVEPLTSYETFKEIAENTLNNASEDVLYTVKVYSDAEKTEEITDGYIGSGMVVEAIEKVEEVADEEIEQEKEETLAEEQITEENEETKEVQTEENEQPSEELPEESTGEIYTVSVIGDMTGDGEINITELTKLIKGVVGLTDWRFTEEEKLAADISGDIEINVVDIELCIDYIVFGKLDFEEATFTVTFKDYDGKVISTKDNYHYGDTIEVPEEPTREADEMYTYEFAGWEPTLSEKVTKDEEYVATYRAIEIATEAVYKVEHYKETIEGTYELEETEELVGKIGEEVTATAKEYTGFSENVESEDRILTGTVLEDGSLVLKLYYDRNTYIVTFKDEDGTEISRKIYKYEERVKLPENPSKEEDNTYTYEFSGWTPEVEETATGDAEYTATYEGTYKEYTVVFKNEDGTPLNTKTYHYGDIIEVPENPTKAEDNTYTYEFSGWSPEVSETVSGDAEYIATYEGIYKEYTVEFKNEDGSMISSKTYHYGDTVEVPENPTKAEDNTYTYNFAGWDKDVEETVTEEAEYIATYTSVYREYTIEFKSNDGTVLSTNKYHYGDTVEIPEAPEKEADDNYEYEFIGWGKEVTTVTKDEVYTAKYNAISYKISVQKEDGTTVKYISFEKAFNEVTDDNIIIQVIEDVTESINIPEGKNITLDLNNHKITSDKEVTITNDGTVLIVENSIEKGGQIENTNNTGIINNGDLTIGYDDGAVEESVVIKGVTKAIQNNSNFYMYDGTLIGKTTIIGNNPVIPEGEEYGLSIKEENGMQIATIKIIEIPAALVGETYYMTLQEAIDENNNTTIYVVKKNVEVIDTVIVDETKTLTIDLNGNTLTKESTGYVIENSGTLTITNTNESKEGNISNTVGSGINNKSILNVNNIKINTSSNGIYNQKDLNMQDVDMENAGVGNGHSSNDINFVMVGGSISSISNSKASNSEGNISVQISDAIINRGISNSSSGTSRIGLEIVNTTINAGIGNSGNIEMKLKDSYINKENGERCIYLSTGPNNLILENTKINFSTSDWNLKGAIHCSGEYNVIIDKGSQIISTSTQRDAYGIYSENYSNSLGRVQLLDGTISANKESSSTSYKGYAIYLQSGYFDFLGGSISATTQTIVGTIGSIAEGKQIQTIQDENKYVSTLVDEINTEYVASVSEEQFYTLQDAIDFCTGTEEPTKITILSDFEQRESIDISEDKNIIVDLNGKKITAYGEFINQGKFEIADSSEGQVGTIEGKASRAILNKENAIFTLSGGNIVLNNTALTKCGIYSMDKASISIKDGILRIDTNSNGNNYIIYNASTGNTEIIGGELQGNSKNIGNLYGIYNFIDEAGGNRYINISGGRIAINVNHNSFQDAYGIYNGTQSNSSSDTSRDTINLDISNLNININGTSWTTSYGIYNLLRGRDTMNLNLKNSYIDSRSGCYYNAYGIYNGSGEAAFIYNSIIGGNIKSTGGEVGYGICNSGNVAIDIGIEGEEYIQEPSILGKDYGIYSNSTNTIKFFQGMIKGTTAISDKVVLTLEEGKEINRYIDEEDNYDTIVLQNKTPEAKIGETEYMTLQEAIDACPDDATESTTIELIKEINNNVQVVTIGENKNIILDLKGYALISGAAHTILNNGDLSIIDTVGGGEIRNNTNIAVGNYGNLNVNNIKINGNSSGIKNYRDSNTELNQVEIDSSSTGIYNDYADIIVKNSKIIMDKGYRGIYNDYGNINIIDSEISATYSGSSTYGISSYGSNNTRVNIINSKITATNNTSQPNLYRAYGIYISSGTVNIGEKNDNVTDTSIITSSHIGIYNTSSNGILNYYGGTINAGERVIQGFVNDIPENKTINIDEETNIMTLIDDQDDDVVQIGDTTYSSLAKAVEAVQTEQEEATLIKVIADFDISRADEQVDIDKNQKVKLDLNGHTITSYRMNLINNKGELEITDTSESKEGKLVSKLYTGINNSGEFILSQGTIQAVRNCIYNKAGNVTVNDGMIELLAEDRGSSEAIYATSDSNIRLLGGNIKAIKNKYSVFYDGPYVAGIRLSYAYAEVNGTNILVDNSSANYYTYGIITNHSTVDFKSGTLEVNTNKSGAFNYAISGRDSYKEDGNDIRISGGNIKISRDAANFIYGIFLESYSSTSKLTMTGGTIEAIINTYQENSGIATAIGARDGDKSTTINILGGKVYASGVYSATAISGNDITIGTKDGNMSKTDLVIEGTTCGISGGNLHFYDGTIRGKTALSKMPVDVEAGYKVSVATSGEVQSATLTLVSTAEAIAQIGNLYFNNLQQAINACGDTDTIKILAGIKCSEPLTIEEGKTVTIDLMGNNIEANGIENVIVNYGTLTIIDTIGGGSIGTIDNQGQLNQ